MGRASYRALDAAAEHRAPAQMRSALMPTAEHERIVTELKQSYERKLLALQQELGGEPAEKPAEPEDQELEDLRAMAEQAGVKVDKRWGVERLYAEIEKAEKG